MSHMVSGILGVVAGTLALGAVHLEVAAGNDLLGPVQRGDASVNGLFSHDDMTVPNVNRASKADRDTVARSADGVTISYKIPGVTDSSVMMRVPVGDAGADIKRVPAPAKAGRVVSACEPVVSVLTAAAKQLGPGRCVT